MRRVPVSEGLSGDRSGWILGSSRKRGNAVSGARDPGRIDLEDDLGGSSAGPVDARDFHGDSTGRGCGSYAGGSGATAAEVEQVCSRRKRRAAFDFVPRMLLLLVLACLLLQDGQPTSAAFTTGKVHCIWPCLSVRATNGADIVDRFPLRN
ncbi:hypothetical protein KM043_000661 [Ampulex compressa]|nr:hypothetical protein KM043_000661 [Ampulex compressa]